MVTFNNPSFWVIALIAIPLFLMLALLIEKRQRAGISTFGQQEIFQRFTRFSSKRRTIVFFGIALLMITLAATEPWLDTKANFMARTFNTVIVMDVSKSMLAEDGPGERPRLEAGIEAVEALMDAYPDGQFALVLYTEDSFSYPPSKDVEAVRTLLREIKESYLVRGLGSDTVGTLEDTAEFIETLTYKPQTIVLVSDGGIYYRDYISQAVVGLNEMNIRVVTVGIGEFVDVMIPVYANGEVIGFKPTHLDEGIMRNIADDTNGYYIHLENENDIVSLVRAKGLAADPVMQKGATSMTWLPVSASMILITIWIFFRNKAK